MNKKTGGPAFPRPSWPGAVGGAQDGMTLRDYFAAKAMQGLIASPRALTNAKNTVNGDEYAKAAYLMADAMMKARSE